MGFKWHNLVQNGLKWPKKSGRTALEWQKVANICLKLVKIAQKLKKEKQLGKKNDKNKDD